MTYRIESVESALDALSPLAIGHSREDLLSDAELGEDGKLQSVEIDWVREGNRKIKSLDNTILGRIKISEGVLIADVNSENRAQQLRKEIEKRLGSMAVHESTLVQTLDDMRKSASQESAEDKELHEAKNEALLADPKAREFLQAMVQKQVEGWVHEKIPALCGRTPLEAVRDPDGREMVEALLLQWERNDERGISPDQIRPDIGAIRRLLNLPAPAA